MTHAYRLLTAESWQIACQLGAIEPNALDQRDGYLHLSGVSTVLTVANRYFDGHDVLVAVGFAVADLAPHLRWEPVYPEQPPYPHVYAPRIALTLPHQVYQLRRNGVLFAASHPFG